MYRFFRLFVVFPCAFFLVYAAPSDKNGKSEPATPGTSVEWPAEKLKINGFVDDCMAYKKTSGKCLIDIHAFRAYVDEHGSRPSSMPLDSARSSILEEMLQNAYFAEQARHHGFDTLMDYRQKIKKETRIRMNRFLNAGELGGKGVIALYNQFYKSDFAPHKEVFVYSVGSTDSAYVDSMYALLRKAQSSLGAGRQQQGLFGATKSLNVPWRKALLRTLPPTVQRVLDSLPEGACTKPIKTSFGFFLFAIGEIVNFPEVPPDTAKYELQRLFGMRTIRFKDNGPAPKDLQAYYQANKRLFVAPDTVLVKFWLVPPEMDTAGASEQNSLLAKSHYRSTLSGETFNAMLFALRQCPGKKLPPGFMGLSDTLLFAGKTALADSLPPELRANVLRAILIGKQKTVQGVSTPYGIFYLKVLLVKKGNGHVPFPQVKDTIATRMSPPNASSISEAQAREFREMAEFYLATAYYRKIIQDAVPPSDYYLEQAIKSGLLDTQSVSGLKKDDPARRESLSSSYTAKMIYKEYYAWREKIGLIKPMETVR